VIRRGTVVAVALVVPSFAWGQMPAAQRRVGALGGASITTLSDLALGTDCTADVGCGSASKRSRTGLQIGAFLNLPLTNRFSVQPELHYIRKGVNTSVELDFGDAILGGELQLQLAFLEVPFLLRRDFGTGNLHPFLVAGPTVAYRVGCSIKAVVSGFAASSSPCDEQESLIEGGEGVTDDPFRTFDAGGVVGFGVEGLRAKRHLSAQVRYAQGFLSVLKDDAGAAKPRNQGISILFGIGF
jgi:hypothetical protein